MLDNFITRTFSREFTGWVGAWLKPKVTRFSLLTFAYYYLLYGIKTKLLSEGNCLVSSYGVKMTMQRESVNIFWEIFRDHAYEQFSSPKEGDIVIDIGANVGTFTVRAAKLVGNTGQVIAIEPEPRNLVLLEYNVKQNNLKNVKIIKKAIWNKTGTLKLYLSKFPGGHSFNALSKNYINVEAECLDNIVSELGLNHVKFIKIDVEGAELEALKGAKKLLACPGIELCIEAGHNSSNGQPELSSLVSYLKSERFQTQTYLKAKEPYIYAVKRN